MLLDFHDTIDRYLHGPPLNKGLKLSFDPRFKRRNEMLNAQVGFHKTAKEDVSHAQLWENTVEARLKDFSIANPVRQVRRTSF